MHRLRREAALGWLGACALGIVGFAAQAGPALDFSELDRNDDGYLTPGECRHLPELYSQLPSLDRDRDGKLNAHEFGRFWERPAAPPAEGMPSFLSPDRIHTKAI